MYSNASHYSDGVMRRNSRRTRLHFLRYDFHRCDNLYGYQCGNHHNSKSILENLCEELSAR